MKEKNYTWLLLTFALFVISLTTTISAALAQSVDDITFMTESFPPLNFEQDGQLRGISVELLEGMLKKLDSKQTRNNIRLLP